MVVLHEQPLDELHVSLNHLKEFGSENPVKVRASECLEHAITSLLAVEVNHSQQQKTELRCVINDCWILLIDFVKLLLLDLMNCFMHFCFYYPAEHWS